MHSATDVKQKWGKKGKEMASSQQGVSFDEMHCCVPVKTLPSTFVEPTDTTLASFFSKVLNSKLC